MKAEIKILETPRDAWQGIKQFIPTEQKINYINRLLEVGFDTIEVGSFVSPKAIPQMMDTGKVLDGIRPGDSESRIMVLVPNEKGCRLAMDHEIVDDVLYPFSISETFLRRNIKSSFHDALVQVEKIMEICKHHQKQLMIYVSMGFGNPYHDAWGPEIVLKWAAHFRASGIKQINIADTLGTATPPLIEKVFGLLLKSLPDVEFGFHIHTSPDDAYSKIDAAYMAGVRNFDAALGGLGGCPMTGKKLISNLNTLDLLDYCEKNNIDHQLKKNKIIEVFNAGNLLI